MNKQNKDAILSTVIVESGQSIKILVVIPKKSFDYSSSSVIEYQFYSLNLILG